MMIVPAGQCFQVGFVVICQSVVEVLLNLGDNPVEGHHFLRGYKIECQL